MSEESVRVAMVGLGFGAEFIPIYQNHPNAEIAAICRRDEKELNKIGDRLGIEKRYTDYEEVLADPDVDFVHINSPIPDHAWMSLAALDAGKHVMCTVPMATTIDECRQIVEKVQETGLKYMMAETVVYSREFLFIKEMYEKGELGKIQYMQASHPQDMEGWPELLGEDDPDALRDARGEPGPGPGRRAGGVRDLLRLGHGQRRDRGQKSGNTFAVESCHIKIKDSDVAAHIWRFLYDMARQYRESFDVYGTKKSLRVDAGRGRSRTCSTRPRGPSRRSPPGHGARLRPPAAGGDPARSPGRSRTPSTSRSSRAAGHGGSHPHLVNEFVSALVEDRDPWPNAVTSANWTCVGICAHESAKQGGAIVRLPDFTLE